MKPRPEPPPWLETLYALVARDKPDKAVELLFEQVDDQMIEGRFAECDDLLQIIDLDRLDLNLIIAVLSITLAPKDSLPSRPAFVQKASAEVQKRAPTRANRLLQGLV